MVFIPIHYSEKKNCIESVLDKMHLLTQVSEELITKERVKYIKQLLFYLFTPLMEAIVLQLICRHSFCSRFRMIAFCQVAAITRQCCQGDLTYSLYSYNFHFTRNVIRSLLQLIIHINSFLNNFIAEISRLCLIEKRIKKSQKVIFYENYNKKGLTSNETSLKRSIIRTKTYSGHQKD